MATADLNDNKLISEEISIIKDKLAKLASKKEIKHEEISDSEYEYRTDNGTDDEVEEPANEIIEPTNEKNEIIETSDIKLEKEVELEVKEDVEVKDVVEDRDEDVKEINMLDVKEKKSTSIDLTKYVKREVKQYLYAFDVNISRLIKKYKHVDDISEEELLKIQKKYNTENKYFNKKSKKLLNKLSDYDDLNKDDYKLLNKKIKKIKTKFTDFVSEFVDIDSDSD